MKSFLYILLAIILMSIFRIYAQSPPNIDSTRSLDSTTLANIHSGLYNDPFLSAIKSHLAATEGEGDFMEGALGSRATEFNFYGHRSRTFEYVFGIIDSTNQNWLDAKRDIINFPVTNTINT